MPGALAEHVPHHALDAFAIDVNGHDLHLDLFTGRQVLFGVINFRPGNFGNMYQAFQVGIEFYKSTKIGNGCNISFDSIANLVFGNNGFLAGFPNGFFGYYKFTFIFIGIDNFYFQIRTNKLLEFF